MVLRKDEDLRASPLEELYLGYKSLELQPGEFVSEFVLPAATSSSRFNFEKVSKRKALDISSVCGAARFEVARAQVHREVDAHADKHQGKDGRH